MTVTSERLLLLVIAAGIWMDAGVRIASRHEPQGAVRTAAAAAPLAGAGGVTILSEAATEIGPVKLSFSLRLGTGRAASQMLG